MYLHQLRDMHARLNDDLERVSRSQSELDRKVSVIYHELEKHNIDEASGYAAALLLQQTLRERRVVKQEFAHLQPIHQRLTQSIIALETTFKRQAAKNAEFSRPSTNIIGGMNQ